MSKHTPFIKEYILGNKCESDNIINTINKAIIKLQNIQKDINTKIENAITSVTYPKGLQVSFDKSKVIKIHKINDQNVVMADDLINLLTTISEELNELKNNSRKTECK